MMFSNDPPHLLVSFQSHPIPPAPHHTIAHTMQYPICHCHVYFVTATISTSTIIQMFKGLSMAGLVAFNITFQPFVAIFGPNPRFHTNICILGVKIKLFSLKEERKVDKQLVKVWCVSYLKFHLAETIELYFSLFWSGQMRSQEGCLPGVQVTGFMLYHYRVKRKVTYLLS